MIAITPERSIESAGRVLIVDDEPDVLAFIEMSLVARGFEVETALDGPEGLEKARAWKPDLVVLDIMMPRMDGLEVARRLRSDPSTAGVGIIILTARGRSADAVEGLATGADDYLVKPLHPMELVARVGGTIRRVKEMTDRSPLTGLPGNVRIEAELEGRVEAGRPFALLYADLDHFKEFNDHYGFIRGDRAIALTAAILQEVAREVAPEPAFVGHVGGDDFVLVCSPEDAEDLCRAIVARFDRRVPSLYDQEDLDRGYIEAKDRRGRKARFPLLSISIGVATTTTGCFSHMAEAVTIATQVKAHAKRTHGSSFQIDRRRTP